MIPNLQDIPGQPDAPAVADVSTLASGIVRWLVGRQMPSGAIRGEDNKESPPGEYAHSFGGLAMGLLAEKAGSQELWQYAERCISYLLTIPPKQRRLQEFNSLALLLLMRSARSSGIAPAVITDRLDAAIRKPDFLYDGGRTVSNNWLAMRGVCFLLKADLTGDTYCADRGEQLLNEMPAWWNGLFVDYPRFIHTRSGNRRLAGECATPLTYHAKMCAMLALASTFHDVGALKETLAAGLSALVSLMSPTGECLYFGRSCNSLFGMAALFFALRCADAMSLEAASQDCRSWRAASEHVAAGLARLRETDGHLRLTPAKNEAVRSGWDVYYHTEVYNAYAAALLLAAPGVLPAHEAAGNVERNDTQINRIEHAGMLSVRTNIRFFAALSTTGQCVLDGSSLFCDMRYSALQPQLIEVDGQVQAPEPPLWWKQGGSKSDAVSPRRVGFVPYITWHGRDYCGRVLSTFLDECNGTDWTGSCHGGPAVALTLPATPVRLMRRLRGKLARTGDLAFTQHVLPGVTLLRAVIVFHRLRALVFIDGYDGDWPGGAEWNGPNARLMPGAGLVVTNPLDARPLAQVCSAPTSRGSARIYACEPAAVTPRRPGCVSAIACSFGDLPIKVEPDGHIVVIAAGDISLCLNLQTGSIS